MAADGRYDNVEFLEVDNAIYEAAETSTTTAREKDGGKIPRSGVRCSKQVAVAVGLLCAVLALLTVAVPLALYQSNMVDREQLVTSYNQLQASVNNLTTSYNQLQASVNNLTEERDELKRMLCESGFTCGGDGLCYYISTEKKTWEESRRWCRDRQSDLMVIKSPEKQALVERLNKPVWLGLTDREEEGSFQWVDGTPLTTPTYWRDDGQPNNHAGNQDCVTFYNGANPINRLRGWNDEKCSTPVQWICERVMC